LLLWRYAWPGLLATLTAVGLARFAYTSIMPFMIADGAVTPAGGAYRGAANFAGYLVGAGLAARLAHRFGMSRAIHAAFVLTALALAASMAPGHFWWHFPWRLLSGVTGGTLMVLGPSFLLAGAPPGTRGRVGGITYTGVGLGIALASVVVTPLAQLDLAWAWGALALGAALSTAFSWRRWRGGGELPEAPRRRLRLPLPALLATAAFASDGIGFMPYALFWVDFIARGLGRGASAGAVNWLLFGIGAALGPSIAGRLGDRVGVGRAQALVFLVKSAAVLLPVFATSTAALAVSSLVVGALTPGVAALSSARVTGLVAAPDQTRAWGAATLAFAAVQTAGGYGLSYLYAATGSYAPLFIAGSAALLLGAGCALAADLLAPARAH
jgi:predicted MFS family arabinose efflux permease